MTRPTAAGLRYAYYPGCSLEATAREYGLSVQAVCSHLGIELAEIPDWSCCGASSGHSTSRRLASTLAGRNHGHARVNAVCGCGGLVRLGTDPGRGA